MEILLIVIPLFLIGIAFGSFLNVLIDRFSTDRSVVKGRSYCENCKKTLSWKELIPLASYIIQGGKCIHCRKRIPFRLFLVELTIGILFPLLYFWGIMMGLNTPSIISVMIVIYCFIGITIADFIYGIVPDKFLIICLAPIIFLITQSNISLTNYFLSAVGAFAFFFLLFVVTRGRGMGLGDVKLSLILGLFLGFPLIVLTLYMAFLTGAFVSIILILWGRKKLKGGTVAFGPFLTISAILCYFFGQNYLLPIIGKLF